MVIFCSSSRFDLTKNCTGILFRFQCKISEATEVINMQLTQLELNPVSSATTHGTGCKSIAGLPQCLFGFPSGLQEQTNNNQENKTL